MASSVSGSHSTCKWISSLLRGNSSYPFTNSLQVVLLVSQGVIPAVAKCAANGIYIVALKTCSKRKCGQQKNTKNNREDDAENSFTPNSSFVSVCWDAAAHITDVGARNMMLHILGKVTRLQFDPLRLAHRIDSFFSLVPLPLAFIKDSNSANNTRSNGGFVTRLQFYLSFLCDSPSVKAHGSSIFGGKPFLLSALIQIQDKTWYPYVSYVTRATVGLLVDPWQCVGTTIYNSAKVIYTGINLQRGQQVALEPATYETGGDAVVASVSAKSLAFITRLSEQYGPYGTFWVNLSTATTTKTSTSPESPTSTSGVVDPVRTHTAAEGTLELSSALTAATGALALTCVSDFVVKQLRRTLIRSLATLFQGTTDDCGDDNCRRGKKALGTCRPPKLTLVELMAVDFKQLVSSLGGLAIGHVCVQGFILLRCVAASPSSVDGGSSGSSKSRMHHLASYELNNVEIGVLAFHVCLSLRVFAPLLAFLCFDNPTKNQKKNKRRGLFAPNEVDEDLFQFSSSSATAAGQSHTKIPSPSNVFANLEAEFAAVVGFPFRDLGKSDVEALKTFCISAKSHIAELASEECGDEEEEIEEDNEKSSKRRKREPLLAYVITHRREPKDEEKKDTVKEDAAPTVIATVDLPSTQLDSMNDGKEKAREEENQETKHEENTNGGEEKEQVLSSSTSSSSHSSSCSSSKSVVVVVASAHPIVANHFGSVALYRGLTRLLLVTDALEEANKNKKDETMRSQGNIKSLASGGSGFGADNLPLYYTNPKFNLYKSSLGGEDANIGDEKDTAADEKVNEHKETTEKKEEEKVFVGEQAGNYACVISQHGLRIFEAIAVISN